MSATRNDIDKRREIIGRSGAAEIAPHLSATGDVETLALESLDIHGVASGDALVRVRAAGAVTSQYRTTIALEFARLTTVRRAERQRCARHSVSIAGWM